LSKTISYNRIDLKRLHRNDYIERILCCNLLIQIKYTVVFIQFSVYKVV